MDRGFPIAYSPRLRWLFSVALLGRKHSEVHLRGRELHVRMGWAFVNGSAAGIVDLRLDPPACGRIAGIPINVSRLGLGLQDPEGFLEAFGVPAED